MRPVAIPALFLGITFLSLVAVASPKGNYVLVVTSPSGRTADILNVIGRAGGSFVSPGRFDWIAVAYSDQQGFAGRLMESGAILVLNHALATGCRQKDL